MSDLMLKYNRQVPRYTSYPPVPYWNNFTDKEKWITHLNSSYSKEQGMDLYVHVPFCEKLCYYCGCNKVVTKNHNVEESFVDTIIKEWKLYCELLNFEPVINSLHFGGGTPTFLSAENLEILINTLTKKKTPNYKGSIEIDPRTVRLEHLNCFKRNGITHISLGIQDFNHEVQVAINRLQSFELVENLMKELRSREFASVNFDVIYGLPRQTEESIADTFKKVNELKPDVVAYYSYAHLPEKISSQRLIKPQDLPLNEQKRSLYEIGKSLLLENGYSDIGMDHFALPGNFLAKAKVNQKLDRNFMGYVDKKSNILLGLGPSAISNSSKSFVQNFKSFMEYESIINSGNLPLSVGHIHSAEDLKAQNIILQLMCQEETEMEDHSYPHMEQIIEELHEMEMDGLIKLNKKKICILPLGKKFIRNVAMVFDFHHRQNSSNKKFSSAI